LTKREDIKIDKGDDKTVDERIAILELESQMLDEKKKLFADETIQTTNTMVKLEEDIKRLTPYMVREK
jgi:dephospho-CoA kinase